MATQSLLYTAPAAFTLTGASLASYAARFGLIVSNTTNLSIDEELSGNITLGAAVSTGNAHILVYGSDATNIDYPGTGADATIVLPGIAIASLEGLQPGQIVPGTGLRYAVKLPAMGLAAATLLPFGPLAVAQFFGNQIPYAGWAPVLVNCTGQTLSATATVFNRTAIRYTIV